MGKTDTNSTPADASRFATTHWSVVLAAGDSAALQHEQALSHLYQSYWFPLYAYLRRKGNDPHQTEDHIQSFFTYLLEKRALCRASQNRGRFRSFLLASMKNFLSDEWGRAHSQKRGGERTLLSLDAMTAETRYALEPADRLSPNKLFDRSWALTVLQHALDQLRKEAAATGKAGLFDHLKNHLTSQENTASYKEIGTELGMTEEAVKSAVYRLRRRYRELVRAEIAQTVATDEQLEEEISELFSALAV